MGNGYTYTWYMHKMTKVTQYFVYSDDSIKQKLET